MPYNKVTEQDIEYLREVSERVFTGAHIHEDFSHDEMTIYGVHMPEVVVEVKTTKQVSAVLKGLNPEQHKGIAMTSSSSDIYSIGVVMYELANDSGSND